MENSLGFEVSKIRSKPIWRLLPDEIDLLDKREQEWVLRALFDMKSDGTFAMLCANRPGTQYKVGYENGWRLQPVCICQERDPNFITAYEEYRPESFYRFRTNRGGPDNEKESR